MPDERKCVAIIGGTGVYGLPGLTGVEKVVETPYGPVNTLVVEAEPYPLVFLNRHGAQRQHPPHAINYRANIVALKMLGVHKIFAINAVGSINREMPPLSLVILDDYLDFTSGRQLSFYDGEETGHAYTEMNAPYCPGLRSQMLELAPGSGLSLHPRGIYVCTNGPRFETPAEIRMFAKLGGDVVGMTGVPEVSLARELGMHYASVAYSINWAAGIENKIGIVHEGVPELLARLVNLIRKVLQLPGQLDCECTRSVLMVSPSKSGGGVYR